MYYANKNELRQLERIEENMLRKLVKTGKGCPIYQIYFVSGHLPARYQIERMKLVFYQYILKQKENSLLLPFLMAQKLEPKKGDWYSEIVKTLKDFGINQTENEIMNMPSLIFKNMVKNKVDLARIEYLNKGNVKREQGLNI